MPDKLEEIFTAAQATSLVGQVDEKMGPVTALALKAAGNELAGALTAQDQVGVCAAVFVGWDGEGRLPGLLALTGNRLLLAWWTGMLRKKVSMVALRLDGIADVSTGRVERQGLQGPSDTVTFSALGRRCTLGSYGDWMDVGVMAAIADALTGRDASATRPESTT